MQHGFDFIMLVTGLMHSKLNEAVKALDKSSLSTFDILIKSGHMRMIQQSDGSWRLTNTRAKDLEILSAMGFVPQKSYVPALKGD